ncbi:MAG TPA: sigma 54-interacting transcriptional regulator [Kofleriaceae bacterium]|nr:sigma 54-interacting transcriptional regulator [Kofleriaceae bacterium]
METTVTGVDAGDAGGGGWVLLLTASHDVRAVPLPENGSVTIGRDPACDVALDHERVSRKHTRITIGAAWTVEDLGSRNGTQVAGAAVKGATTFVAGEPITIGPFTAVVVPRAVSAVRTALGSSSVVIDDPALAKPTPLLVALARSSVSVVIHGETGAGKEVLARALHGLSGRPGPMLGINCAALAPQLLESELFGHEKGAFTGAVGKVGLLEAAARGTVLFDEIAEMPLELQAKLLRAIESREIMRVGSVRAQPIDVRFVAASHRDLMGACTAGTFRRDLFYRLAGITLTVSPLRDRRHQIAPLAAKFAREATGRDHALTPAALARLGAHDWPGNVRELKNVVERASLLAGSDPIGAEHLLFDQAPVPLPVPVPLPGGSGSDDGTERARILAALEECAGNQTHAAKKLGISRATLVHKLDLYGVPRPRKR